MELERSSLQQLALTGMNHFHSSPATVYDSIVNYNATLLEKNSHNILIVKQFFIQHKTGKFTSSTFSDNLPATSVSKKTCSLLA